MTAGVIFDMDGVLVDSAEAHLESWVVLGRNHGFDIPREVFHDSFGQSGRDIIRLIFGEALDAEGIRDRVAEKEAIYRDLIRGRAPLMEGVRDVVQDLHEAGYRLAVGTSGPPENVDLILEEADIAAYFMATVNGFDVERGKPAPDIFLKAADRLGLAAGRCVVVEDAPVGIEASVAAGCPAVGLAGMHAREALLESGATRVVERLVDLTPALVAEILH